MTTTGARRTLLLRSLPLLLFVLLALVAAPQRPSASPASSPRAAAISSAADASDPSEPSDAAAEFERAPADRATVLSTQFTAGVRGSRAPPAASL
jgi:hypothetical protein